MRFPDVRFLKLLVLAFVLVGCATQTPVRTSTAECELSRTGRFALKTEQFGRDPEAVQGGFAWDDSGAKLSLDLTNPFGTILARVLVVQGMSTLTRPNGEVLQAKTPDELVALVLGQSVPVQGLRDWLLLDLPVRALSSMTQISRDSEGRIQNFEQNGWRVQRSRFDDLGPRMLVMSRQEQGKTIQIRLVIDNP